MNPSISKLAALAAKPQRLILGLMSGTSLDGLDLALCAISGAGIDTQLQLQQFASLPYQAPFREAVRRVFAQPTISLEDLTLLNPYIARAHAQLVRKCLIDWQISPSTIDLLASHGQTVYHAPFSQHRRQGFPNASLQLGDGDHLAHLTGILTLSDFRQKHIAAGGEGAPLAVYGDYLLFSAPQQARVLINLGGIANFTYLPAHNAPSGVFSTDTGPANTLLDALVRLHFPGRLFDEGGELAATGQVSQALLKSLFAHPFFALPFPKTTGPEVFSLSMLAHAQADSQTSILSPTDLLATLTRFSAESLALALRACVPMPVMGYISGGGVHNQVLLQHLSALLPGFTFQPSTALGIAPEAKEAVLFAVLANEAIAGTGLALGGLPAFSMGKISLPN